jgi:DHA1 family inner membrane transport protein
VLIRVLTLCSFAVATAEFVLVGLLPEIAADLDVSTSAAGQLVTVYMLVVTVGGPAATVVTRRLPRRALLAATMALATVAAGGSALAGSYGALLTARLGSALAQALFMAVASQVAMAAVPPERQTAAVARVFAGFALATVIGLPLGSLVGQAYGWQATFVLVAVLAGAGLAGVAVFCPPIPAPAATSVGSSVSAVTRPAVLTGLAVTLLTLTGFVAVFTYVAPMLREVSGFSPGWVSVALVGYGLGTVAGNVVAGRVPPSAIGRVLPVPIAVVAAVLLGLGVLLRYRPAALVGLVLLGTAAFVVVPLVQTWLMGRVGAAAAGLIAAVNISVAGVAGALGAALGGLVLSAGLGLAAIGPVAAVPVLVAVLVALGLAARSPGPDGVEDVEQRVPVEHAPDVQDVLVHELRDQQHHQPDRRRAPAQVLALEDDEQPPQLEQVGEEEQHPPVAGDLEEDGADDPPREQRAGDVAGERRPAEGDEHLDGEVVEVEALVEALVVVREAEGVEDDEVRGVGEEREHAAEQRTPEDQQGHREAHREDDQDPHAAGR